MVTDPVLVNPFLVGVAPFNIGAKFIAAIHRAMAAAEGLLRPMMRCMAVLWHQAVFSLLLGMDHTSSIQIQRRRAVFVTPDDHSCFALQYTGVDAAGRAMGLHTQLPPAFALAPVTVQQQHLYVVTQHTPHNNVRHNASL